MTEKQYLYSDSLVTTEWLAANLDDPALRIFDCTTYLVYEGDGPYRVVSGLADYQAAHIPGSGFLDLQGELSDAASPYRFTMLSLEALAAKFAARGIADGSRVILYSRKNMQWASRIWWMLRAVGFDAAALLDGGWDKWQAEGRPVSAAPCQYSPASFESRPRPDLFTGKEAVQAAIGDAAITTINALAPDLHSGENPRYGRPGRIPGSKNVPALSLLDPESLELRPAEQTAAAFIFASAAPSNPVITYCGGGIAATLDAFVLHRLGYREITVYDNSMSEWANDESLPIETD